MSYRTSSDTKSTVIPRFPSSARPLMILFSNVPPSSLAFFLPFFFFDTVQAFTLALVLDARDVDMSISTRPRQGHLFFVAFIRRPHLFLSLFSKKV